MLIATPLLMAGAVTAYAIVDSGGLVTVAEQHKPVLMKTFQDDLNRLVQAGKNDEAFDLAFEAGDTIFGSVFNALDGSGANVGNGQRYTHVPRTDLTGPRQWATHTPMRVTGPNAAGCFECHNTPVEDAAGLPSGNVHRDPLRTGSPAKFIERNAPHLFGGGAIQRLAEEMTDELRGRAAAAIGQCPPAGCNIPVTLSSKGVAFGSIVIKRPAAGPTPLPPNNCTGADAIPFIDAADCQAGVSADLAGLRGIARDLVVRPFQWKGSIAFIRDFNRDASNQEIGMQAVELTGENNDGDFDGVINELRVGDETVLALYIAAQPRPTTRVELARLGQIPKLGNAETDAIARGEKVFEQARCSGCHVPELRLDKAIFSEPSQNRNFRDERFPAGQDPKSRALDPAMAVTFDLTNDQPDNRIKVNGKEVRFGAFERGPKAGSAIVRLYGDLKRHDMGPGLAESVDEIGSGAATFLTENLWGVGSTAPYLHDGRATTLTEAILEHGGEAAAARTAFVALSKNSKADLIAFLNNLVLFVVPAP